LRTAEKYVGRRFPGYNEFRMRRCKHAEKLLGKAIAQSKFRRAAR
jgi:hypothetical protein